MTPPGPARFPGASTLVEGIKPRAGTYGQHCSAPCNLVKWSNHRTKTSVTGRLRERPRTKRLLIPARIYAGLRKCPDFPPDFSSRRTSSMRMPRSAALHMS